MSLWRETVAALGSRADRKIDRLTDKIEQRWPSDKPLQIVPYYGYGTTERLVLQGRILRGNFDSTVQRTDARTDADEDTVWDNLHTMYHRFASDEMANVPVKALFQGQTVQAQSDREGYFELKVDAEQPLPTNQLWHKVPLVIPADGVGDNQPGAAKVTATGKVMVPPQTSKIGVISDIDDTVLQTNATNLLKMARVVFLNNAQTRLPFEGVAAFYAALQRGASGMEKNPLFYVSSSPWNLYDLLVDFMQIHGIPAGPLFLQDYGLEPGKLVTASHKAHKLAAIEQIFATYPRLPFILIGDSGQEDPEIYVDLLSRHAERIRAIYIRDVSTAAREQAMAELIAEAKAHNVEMLHVADTQAAANHAYAKGFIQGKELATVRANQQKDAAAPSDLEVLLEKTTRG